VAASGIRPAADLSLFRAGNIISDAVFTDAGTMTADQIQAFLQSKGGTCQSGYTCLKDFRISSVDRPADRYCNGYSGVPNERASSILARVAQSCGINPQVLVVMLQKEQGLVTHTWPSQWRYDAALGQGCPDDAPCDPSFVGFFHQIYGAARQMKIYLEGRYFQWYAPGNTWSILYNPDRSCGSSPVYIENAATAALYYYTPYQPNRAALAAGYGEGDYCSAYGNRNFFNYFTDWFGSPQLPSSRLVKASDSDAIYLYASSQKYHIVSGTDLAAYMSRLGWYQTVSSGYLAAIPETTTATRFIRDARDGAMYLLETDGTKHHFPSAELVTGYGFSMAVYTSLPANLIDRFPTGADVGVYFKDDVSTAYYRWENGTRRHVTTLGAWNQLPAAGRGYVATIPQANVAGIPQGAAILPAGTLVKEASAPEVYISGTGSEIVHIPSWGIAQDAGITGLTLLNDGALAQNPRVPGGFAPFVVCNDATFAVDGEGLTRILNPTAGAPTAQLPDSLCATLPRTGRTNSYALFAKSPQADPVYLISGAQLRHVRSQQRLQDVNAGRPLAFLSWTPETRGYFAVGAPLLADGSFVSFGGPEIYVVQGGVIRHVQSTATLLQLASPGWPSIEALPSGWRGSYAEGPPIP